VRAGVLEDLQHAGAGAVPDLGAELLPVQDHQVLQAVGPRPSQLLVVCRGTKSTTPEQRLRSGRCWSESREAGHGVSVPLVRCGLSA